MSIICRTGGIAGGRAVDMSDAFELALDHALGDRMRNDAGFCGDVWSALANVVWSRGDGADALLSFRAAGDAIAAIRGSGDYLEWYCSGPAGVVSDEIRHALAAQGWAPDALATIIMQAA